MIKKLFILAICMFLMTSTTIYAGVQPNDPNKEISKQEKAIKSYKNFVEKRNLNKEYTDSYAGAYIDDQGNLNINIVGDFSKLKSNVNDNNIKYNNAKWSMNQLEKALEKINKNMDALNIKATELDEKNNTIIVYMKDINNESMKKIIEESSFPDITFKQTDLEISFSGDVINGNPVTVPVGTGTATDTIGIGVINNSTGKKGFLMPGHTAASVGCTATYAGNAVGTLKKKVLGGAVDGSFVECNSSYTPTQRFMNGDTYVNSSVDPANLIVGGYVEKYGRVSGKTTGYITSLSYTANINGTQMTLVKADYKSLSGDSGGAIAYWRYVGSGSSVHSVMGLQSANALDSNGNWVPGASFSLFSKIDGIFNALGVSDL